MKTKYLHVTHNDNSGYHSSQLTFRTLAGSPAECLWPVAGRDHASLPPWRSRLEARKEGGRGRGSSPRARSEEIERLKNTSHWYACMFICHNARAAWRAWRRSLVLRRGESPSEVIGHDLVPGVDVYVRRRNTVDRGGRAAHHARGAAPYGTLGTRQITPLLPLLSYM